MPQAVRAAAAQPSASVVKKDKTNKSQEKELKQAKDVVSCEECRLLKLKHDKTFLCSSCKRHSCGPGNRYVAQVVRRQRAENERMMKDLVEMINRLHLLPCRSLPKLTDAERLYLTHNDGCFKCRRANVGHTSRVCPNDFPSPDNYRPLVPNDWKPPTSSNTASHTYPARIATIDDTPADNPLAAQLSPRRRRQTPQV